MVMRVTRLSGLARRHPTALALLVVFLAPTLILGVGAVHTLLLDAHDLGIWDIPATQESLGLPRGIPTGEEAWSGPGVYPTVAERAGIADAAYIRQTPYNGTIHVCAYPHWDIEWREPYHSNLGRALSTITQGLAYMRLYPRFTMIVDDAWFLRAFWENYPQYRGDLVRYLREGRLEVVHGGISQPTEVVPSAESLVRDLAYGRTWLRQTLGVETKVAWLADVLDGHHMGFGKLLADAGYEYVFWARDVRGGNNNSVFKWQLDDGQNLLVFPASRYNQPYTTFVEDFVRDVKKKLEPVVSAPCNENLLVTLGADFALPLPWLENFVDAWNAGAAAETGYRMVCSTPTRFFTAVEHSGGYAEIATRDYDTADRDLRDTGCLVAKHMVKAENAAWEEVLAKLETYGTLAALQTAQFPAAARYHYDDPLLRSAWWVKTGAHHHDSLTGTHTQPAHDALLGRFVYGMPALRDGLTRARHAFAGLTYGTPLVPSAVAAVVGGWNAASSAVEAGTLRALPVLNARAWNQTAPVQFPWNWTGLAGTGASGAGRTVVVYDEHGQVVPVQAVDVTRGDSFHRYADSGMGVSTGYLGVYPFAEVRTGGETAPAVGFAPPGTYFRQAPSGTLNSTSPFAPTYPAADASFVFVAPDVPACGYKYFFVHEVPASSAPPLPAGWATPEADLAARTLGNGLYNLTFDARGAITSVVKTTRAGTATEFVNPTRPLNVLEIRPTAKSEYHVHAFQYAPLLTSENITLAATTWDVEAGPVFASVRVSQAMFNSTFNRTVRLYAGVDWVQCSVNLHYDPRDANNPTLARVAVLVDLTPANALAKCVFGEPFLARYRTGHARGEFPVNNWACLESADARQAVFVATRGTTACYYDREQFLLYLFKRTTPGLWGVTSGPEEQWSENLTGYVGAAYDLQFGNGSLLAGQTRAAALARIHHAEAMRTPLDAIAPVPCRTSADPADRVTLPLAWSWLAVNDAGAGTGTDPGTSTSTAAEAGVVITSVTRALDKNAVVVRGWNPFPGATALALALFRLVPDASNPGCETEFGPGSGPATVACPVTLASSPVLVDVLDQLRVPVLGVPVTVPFDPSTQEVTLPVGPAGIASVLLNVSGTSDLIAPRVLSYALERGGSVLDPAWTTVRVEVAGETPASAVRVAFLDDPGTGAYDNDDVSRKAGAPGEFWVQPAMDAPTPDSTARWIIANASTRSPRASAGITASTPATWRVPVPGEVARPRAVPGTFYTDHLDQTTDHAVRVIILVEDAAGNVAFYENFSYLAPPGTRAQTVVPWVVGILAAVCVLGVGRVLLLRRKRGRHHEPRADSDLALLPGSTPGRLSGYLHEPSTLAPAPRLRRAAYLETLVASVAFVVAAFEVEIYLLAAFGQLVDGSLGASVLDLLGEDPATGGYAGLVMVEAVALLVLVLAASATTPRSDARYVLPAFFLAILVGHLAGISVGFLRGALLGPDGRWIPVTWVTPGSAAYHPWNAAREFGAYAGVLYWGSVLKGYAVPLVLVVAAVLGWATRRAVVRVTGRRGKGRAPGPRVSSSPHGWKGLSRPRA